MTRDPHYKRILGRMGYYSYQSGLIHRHLGQEGGWDSHLSRCRNYILKAAGVFKPDTITILGSGWLLDIPLVELIEKTRQVNLVDIVHPQEVAGQVSRYSNVRLIEADISGGLIQEVWNKAGGFSLFRKPVPLSSMTIPEFIPDFEPGLVVSLNILTQLENLLVEFIRKRMKAGEEEYSNFKREIQEKHLAFLRKHNSVLITDFEEVYFSPKGDVRTVSTMLAMIGDDTGREEWTWDFDLRQSDFYNSRSIMKVMAVMFSR